MEETKTALVQGGDRTHEHKIVEQMNQDWAKPLYGSNATPTPHQKRQRAQAQDLTDKIVSWSIVAKAEGQI